MTSSPAWSGRSCRCDVVAAIASRFACDPEPTRNVCERSTSFANASENARAKRPSVSQPSSEASVSASSSGAPITRPATGTLVSPATNSLCTNASSA